MSAYSERFRADAALVLTAFLWGGAFVAQRSAMAVMGPLEFNAVRDLLAALVLLPAAMLFSRGNFTASNLRAGLILGLLLFVGGTLQQVGVVETTAGKAGFITGLYVVLIPLFLQLFWSKRSRNGIWLAAIVAVLGLGLLSIQSDFSIARGDLLVLLCAAVFAFHVISAGNFMARDRLDPILLCMIQNIVAGVLSWLWVGSQGSFVIHGVSSAWIEIAYIGVFSSAFAYGLQLWAQRHTPAADTAIILSLESVFAAIAGWYFLAEMMTPVQLIGCGFILASVVISQLPELRRVPRTVEM